MCLNKKGDKNIRLKEKCGEVMQLRNSSVLCCDQTVQYICSPGFSHSQKLKVSPGKTLNMHSWGITILFSHILRTHSWTAETKKQPSQTLKSFLIFIAQGVENSAAGYDLGVKWLALCITVWRLVRLSSGSVHTLWQQTGCPQEYQGGLGEGQRGDAGDRWEAQRASMVCGAK